MHTPLVVDVAQSSKLVFAAVPFMFQAPLDVVPFAEFVGRRSNADQVQVPQEESQENKAHDATQDRNKHNHSLGCEHVLSNDQVCGVFLFSSCWVHEYSMKKVFLQNDVVRDRGSQAAAVKADHQVPKQKNEKPLVVPHTNAIVDPNAMMVKLGHTNITQRAMF